jgi:hypothetical protein
MEDLIKALQIFLKYKNERSSTHCEHDILMVVGISKEQVSKEDKKELKNLSFSWDSEYDCWRSFRFGSC